MAKNPIPEELNKRRALKIIQAAAEKSENVFVTTHAEERMKEREINLTQVLRVLRIGTVFDGPTDNQLENNWECGMKGFSAGETIGLRIGIERDKTGVTVITVFRIG